MLEDFTLDTFAHRIGQAFRLDVAGVGGLDLLLESATEIPGPGWRPADAAGRRAPFSLIFRGPPHVVLAQRMYAFTHADLGSFEIFIVPVGRTSEGVAYEAVFS